MGTKHFDFFGWKIPIGASSSKIEDLAADISQEKRMDKDEVLLQLKEKQTKATTNLNLEKNRGRKSHTFVSL